MISVPGAGFEAAVDDALACGAKAIVGITAGFAEAGPAGLARQRAVAARVRDAGAVLVGPNCLGIADNTTELYLASDRFAPGGVALLSQSGNLALELQLRGAPHGLGFSRFVSLGNQADVTLVDLVEDCARHEATSVIAVYAEDFGDGRAFARAAAEAGKPVVLLTAGRGTASARSAQSHTGALTTSADVVAAACRDAGVELVRTPREMTIVLAALSGGVRTSGRRTAVFTDGGGHGAIAADAAEDAGLDVPELDAPTQDRLRTVLWDQSAVGNPVDLAGMGEQRPLSYADTVAELLAAEEVDAVLMTGYFGGYAASDGGLGGGPAGGSVLAEGETRAAKEIVAHLAAMPKPLVVQSMYPQSPSCRVLVEGGVPVFSATEDAARALAAMTGRAVVGSSPEASGGAPSGAPSGPSSGVSSGPSSPTPSGPPSPASSGPSARPSSGAAVDVSSRIAPLPAIRPPLRDPGYHGIRALLEDAGVPFPPAREITDEARLLAAAGEFDGPYVLKALHVLHKSDAGGVVLRLADRDALLAVYRDMHARLGAPLYSVEAMADLSDGVELIVGVNRDPRFGPVAMVGLGGVLTESLRDVAFSLAPVPAGRAEELLRGLRTAALLAGVRGRPAVDVAAAAAVIERITAVAAAHPEIAELEVNPLLVRPEGALALDARAVLG